MLNIIVEISKYLILIIMLLYTLESFWVFRYEEDYDQRYVLRNQLLLIIFLDFTAFLVIFLQTEELKVLYIFGTLILYLVIVQALYRVFYKTSSILLLNHMCMLLSVGFIMLARLDPDCDDSENVFFEKADLALCRRRISDAVGCSGSRVKCKRSQD